MTATADTERRNKATEALTEALAGLRESEGWQQWLRARKGFRRYSLNNQLLIAFQRPDATKVMSFRAWCKYGRIVEKGERALYIYAPAPVKMLGKDSKPLLDQDGKPRKRTLFKATPVFAFEQTKALEAREGVEFLPLEPPAGQVIGDPVEAMLATQRLEAYLRDHGWQVGHIEGNAEGWCDSVAQRIHVREDLSPLPKLRVLVHEAAHGLGAIGYADYDRKVAEVLVDSITWVVLDSLGIRSGDSIPYVAGWSDDADELLKEYAALVHSVAAEIEHAIGLSFDA